jgi:8-oxo-dGTP pyrophosphatase MutT (NUDIX family)
MRPPGHPVTAHLVVTAPGGRLLILRSATDHTRWQLPGGIAEEHESPAAAAERETREETALHLIRLDVGEVDAWQLAAQPAAAHLLHPLQAQRLQARSTTTPGRPSTSNNRPDRVTTRGRWRALQLRHTPRRDKPGRT